jgi:hypothetical protein
MFDAPPEGEWVSLDCETTGLNVRTDEIVSIGAVRIVGNRIMTSERLELLVRPERGVSAESVRIHRLRERDLAQGLPHRRGLEAADALHWQPAPGRLLPGVRPGHAESSPVSDAGAGAAAAGHRGLFALLRLQVPAAACVPAAGQRVDRPAFCDADGRSGFAGARCARRRQRCGHGCAGFHQAAAFATPLTGPASKKRTGRRARFFS